jgi:hypothetical protein
MRKMISHKKAPVYCLYVFWLIVLTNQVSFSQKLTKSYNISSKASSVLDVTQKSNTVEKILLVGDTIWVASGKGLSKSTDNGNSWYNYYGTSDFGNESVSAIAFADGILCAALWHWTDTEDGTLPAGGGIRISTNYGKSWTAISQPLDIRTDSTITYGSNVLYALPITTTVYNFVRDIAITKNTIWIASNSAGLRKSTDMGATWQRVVLPPDNLDSIKPTDILSFSLRPKVGSVGNYNHQGFSLLAVGNDTIYAGMVGGINKSTDGGISWAKLSHQNQSRPISGNHILRIRQNPVDKSIWAATWKADDDTEFWGVSVSSDGGKSWKITLNDSRTLDFIFPQIKNGSTTTTDVIALTQNGLYRSSNNGSTWISAPRITDSEKKFTLLTNNFIGGAVNSQKTPAELWFGTSDGLVKLTQPASNFWDGTWKIYFASEPLQSKNESYAFPNPFSPTYRSVRIKYNLSSSTNVTVYILDFGMNLVRTVIQNTARNAGDNFEAWDGRDGGGGIVPNGVYFYKIEANFDKPLFGKIMVAR